MRCSKVCITGWVKALCCLGLYRMQMNIPVAGMIVGQPGDRREFESRNATTAIGVQALTYQGCWTFRSGFFIRLT